MYGSNRVVDSSWREGICRIVGVAVVVHVER